jgi:undecaprenyl-diphosphatase
MEYLQSAILGLIQGLTEFLPVSSSAHLVLAPYLLGIKSTLLNSLSYDAALHAGTLFGVLIYFRKKVWSLLLAFFRGFNDRETRMGSDFRLSVHIIAATIPAVIAALFLEDYIETVFRNPVNVAWALIGFGILLYIADETGRRVKLNNKMTLSHSLIIGLAQALALVPGVSRSGVTITAALFLGYKREEAAEFSFLISIPVILGAVVFSIKDVITSGNDGNIGVIAIGFAAAVISGLFAVNLLLSFVKKYSYTAFVIYRIALGAVIILMAVEHLI